MKKVLLILFIFCSPVFMVSAQEPIKILLVPGHDDKDWWMKEKITNGDFIIKKGTPHNTASKDVSIILHGINKWANENEMDAVVHVHFNDYHRPNKWIIGDRKGFAVYMPEEQMVNSTTSANFAKNIFKKLKTKYTTSNYEGEKGGLVASQSLIALGSNDTLLPTVRSVLIEYGYIYRFGNKTSRQKAYDTFTNLTVTGIKDYFLSRPLIGLK
ncbi:N-acetylmuramoyl-L-alanine amidase [Candidatus Nomurabacteria bacterium]|nr:N-acetylmuramoyl-L-alanine amidase [Candidatus Nomurabacteria bacterium]